MSTELENNPIFESLYQIYKHDVVKEWLQCYEDAKKKFGEGFEKMMEELGQIILDMREECKPGTSIFAASVLLTLPDEETTPEELATYKYTKAAAIWLIAKENNIEL